MPLDNLTQVRRSVLRCDRVGKCGGWDEQTISNCPIAASGSGMLPESPRGLMILAREILEGRLGYAKDFADIVFRCTACGNCTMLCNSVDLETGGPLTQPDRVIAAMKADLIEAGFAPPTVRDYLKNLFGFANAYGAPQDERAAGFAGEAIAAFEASHEFLYYVGDVGSFDPRGRKAARDFARLLSAARVPFGILGTDEICDGNEANWLGEKALFQHLAERNIEKFKARGVRKIVTFSPHAFNAMKNDYPALGADFSVQHYTQLLRELTAAKKLPFKNAFAAKITYHDPCFLGRRNAEYDAPRQVLAAVPGVEIVEMARSRENSFCCGGGSANAFADVLQGGDRRPSRVRVREAFATGASVMAVACPQCLIMFEDAIKTENLTGKFRVLDVAEIAAAAL